MTWWKTIKPIEGNGTANARCAYCACSIEWGRSCACGTARLVRQLLEAAQEEVSEAKSQPAGFADGWADAMNSEFPRILTPREAQGARDRYMSEYSRGYHEARKALWLHANPPKPAKEEPQTSDDDDRIAHVPCARS